MLCGRIKFVISLALLTFELETVLSDRERLQREKGHECDLGVPPSLIPMQGTRMLPELVQQE